MSWAYYIGAMLVGAAIGELISYVFDRDKKYNQDRSDQNKSILHPLNILAVLIILAIIACAYIISSKLFQNFVAETILALYCIYFSLSRKKEKGQKAFLLRKPIFITLSILLAVSSFVLGEASGKGMEVAIVIPLLFFFDFLGSTRKAETTEDGRIMQPRLILYVFIFGLILMGSATILIITTRDIQSEIEAILILAGFNLLCVFGIILFFQGYHRIMDDELDYFRLFRSRERLKFSEVTELKYDEIFRKFILRTNTGKIARLELGLNGLPVFAKACLKYVPDTAIDSNTMKVLQRTAEGEPPEMVGK